jgi:hypothetical protein
LPNLAYGSVDVERDMRNRAGPLRRPTGTDVRTEATMSRHRSALATSLLATVAIAAAACGAAHDTATLRAAAPTTSGPSGVPPEFRHACGHPRAVVYVQRLPVTVSGAHCDLVGVTVDFKGVEAQIQPRGQGTGVAADGATVSHEIEVLTARNGDVRITGD